MKENKKTNKQFNQSEKAKRGWLFSVFFMLLVVCLIIFLSFVKIQEDNRDVLVGLIGMITGAVSSMLAIASGRDPSEVEELKDKLSSANADRAALIARLRDCQIQLQLKNEQVFELQTAVIDKLSIFTNAKPIKTKTTDDIILHDDVETWIPKVDREENIK